jgi:hypothetical protein
MGRRKLPVWRRLLVWNKPIMRCVRLGEVEDSMLRYIMDVYNCDYSDAIRLAILHLFTNTIEVLEANSNLTYEKFLASICRVLHRYHGIVPRDCRNYVSSQTSS